MYKHNNVINKYNIISYNKNKIDLLVSDKYLKKTVIISNKIKKVIFEILKIIIIPNSVKYLHGNIKQNICISKNIIYLLTHEQIYKMPNSIIYLEMSHFENSKYMYNLNNLFILKIYNEFNKIKDIQSLSNIHELQICFSDINYVHALNNINKLCLCHCKNITDVSALKNIHTLNLYYCDNIIYENAFENAFENVHILKLKSDLVINIDSLCNIYKLNLFHTQVNDISKLSDVHELKLLKYYHKNTNGVDKLNNIIWL
jgi:hypothetical protein